MGDRDSQGRRSESPLLRLLGAALFGRVHLFVRGREFDALGRDLARETSPADAPDKTLPGSDISEAEQEAALRREQQRRAQRRVRHEG